MTVLRLCILENGLVPEPLKESFVSYPKMIRDWLSPQLPEAEFYTVSVVSGDSLPEPAAFDGYLLTGSKHSVREEADWMQAEIDFLRRAKELERPLFGICFGHQLMADAFGGRTEQAPQGWGLGTQNYVSAGPNVEGAGDVLAFHQDQVKTSPAQVEVLAGTGHCPNGVFAYPFPALSVQYHPEFTPDYVEALLNLFGGKLFEESRAQDAREGLKKAALANSEVAAWAARFFRNHGPETNRSRSGSAQVHQSEPHNTSWRENSPKTKNPNECQ
ncbi:MULTISPECIES: type 1 glutamine amidotransferase [Marinobacter]|jgi:GMP synthase-like glutamine amidotransferase|uniref:type 1 glutamine amidotransferase n=1 Tax=Marinobacter TaxID=2742 RepID=UPI0029423ADC|nr:type 1 glutamine amidotransferase [Marinobacter salarius]WOI20356.1 type 1 glutamine amidotransferase [Marinobacter salarius]